MATIITRAGKGTPLTNTEVDDNFTNLNTDKAELSGATFTGNVGIGTSPVNKLHILNTGTTAISNAIANSGAILDGGTGNIALNMITPSTGACYINFGDSADSNVGRLIYNHNNDAMTFDTNTEERMRITSSGKVGIGTTSPSTNLQVENNSNATTTTAVQNTTAGASARANFRAISDNSQLDIYATSSSYTGVASWQDAGVISTAASTSGGLILNSQAHDIKFQTATTERMRIDSSGNVLVGTTDTDRVADTGITLTPSGFIDISRSGTIAGRFARQGSNGSVIDFRREGTNIVGSISVTTSATSYNTSSDERLKENIADSADAGSKVDAIQIRQFDWKADGSHQDYGVIAQELATVAPEAVHQPEDSEEMMGVDYSKLVPMLIKEVQSLRSRVAELENN